MLSRCRCGNGNDNVPADSFWNRLKTNLLTSGSLRNLNEAPLKSSFYLACYNHAHRHSARAYLVSTTSKPTAQLTVA